MAMKLMVGILAAGLVAVTSIRAQPAPSVLFIGNSFTFADGAPVRFYRADTVHDLNNEGIGGVPALFKSFATQVGLNYDVSLETHPGIGLDWHLANKREAIGGRPWDVVVMHGYSTLDAEKPGDSDKLVRTTVEMSELLRAKNPRVAIHLVATWTRADQTFASSGHWFQKPVEAMATDVRAAYDRAAAAAHATSVIPVGEAWLRAIHTGAADANPYDGIDAGKFDLWAYDHYHASTFGYYLEALSDFGAVTGKDPRVLGDTECSAFELGLARPQVRVLQQIAFDELSAAKLVPSAQAAPAAGRAGPVRCAGAR